VLERNIRALQLRRQREEKKATVEERLAEAITRFTGSMRFVYPTVGTQPSAALVRRCYKTAHARPRRRAPAG
jgi:hypothetical protein